jgi:UDP-N-acetylglucosamine--N-acetylmuramyl-(pentapeptide) pyrophosphoryl-undecaprenol N-acetylglucosamine transferase
MTFLIAAAGTGGHVFPGLAVGQALVDLGVSHDRVTYVGGDRLESRVYPDAGFPFRRIEVRGLQRSLTAENLGVPGLVLRARKEVERIIADQEVRSTLGMGGYVTVPVGMAARRLRIPFFHSEQNATAGLANRIVARWARASFGSFPRTVGLPSAEWVGNPVREPFWAFDREAARPGSLGRYGLSADLPVLGVFGGSLGARALNDGVADALQRWTGPMIQVLHLTGDRFLAGVTGIEPSASVHWVRIGFEPEMEHFFAAVDLVLARAGGGVAEITATATPSILVPGDFGSGGHQAGNARALTDAGAAMTLPEAALSELPGVLEATLLRPEILEGMRIAAGAMARPGAAHAIASALIEAAE